MQIIRIEKKKGRRDKRSAEREITIRREGPTISQEWEMAKEK